MANQHTAASFLSVLALLGALAMGALWMASERGHSERMRREAAAQRQAMLAQEKSIAELREIAESALAQAAAQEKAIADLRAEIAKLRTEAAQQEAAIVQRMKQELGTGRTNVFTTGAVPVGGFVQAENPGHGRSWGPEQVTGEPDTFTAGDHTTAWAPKSAGGQLEWLILDYAEAARITKVKIYETYNPGSLTKVTVFDDAGNETEVWQGKDPTATDAGMGVSEIALATPRSSKRVKLYLDCTQFTNWCEIDAVGIVDDVAKTHWAVNASASSTYAEPNVAVQAQRNNCPVKPPTPPPVETAPVEF